MNIRQLLLDYGFSSAGSVQWDRDKDQLWFTEQVRNAPMVYAFLTAGRLRYIGQSSNGLVRIKTGYCGIRKLNVSHCQKQIRVALDEGQKVELLVYYPKPRRWRHLRVTDEVAIENALIEKFKPEWNLARGKNRQ